MKERFKEWLLRCLIRDLFRRGYLLHLLKVITNEYLDMFYEDSLYEARRHLHDLVDMAADQVAAQGDPLL